MLGFEEIFAGAVKHGTLMSGDRLQVLWDAAQSVAHLKGDWFECGVYKGGSAYVLAQAIMRDGGSRILRLFDTFEGLPESDPEIDKHRKGQFAASPAEVLTAVRGLKTVLIYQGEIPGSFPIDEPAISLAHLDLALYRSTAAAIDFIWPRLEVGGKLVIDDYGWQECPGVTKAVDERFPPEAVKVLAPMQCVITKQVQNATHVGHDQT